MLKKPDVSIIILTKDKVDFLKKCIDSIFMKNKTSNYEIIVISNNSVEQDTYEYLNEIDELCNVKVYTQDVPFNYSALNNFGAMKATGDFLLFLNNDTEFITNEALNEFIAMMDNQEIGSIGATLLYPDNRIQHVGIAINQELAWHPLQYLTLEEIENFNRPEEYCAVTGACLFIKKEIFEKLNGFDEDLPVIYNDVDLGMRVVELGLKNICAPIQLYHYESLTRGKTMYLNDRDFFFDKWKDKISLKKAFNDSANIIENILLPQLQSTPNRVICMWGTGSYAKNIQKYLLNFDIRIDFYIDGNKESQSKLFQGLKVYPPEFLQTHTNKPYVLVASSFYMEIAEALNKMGYCEKENYWHMLM